MRAHRRRAAAPAGAGAPGRAGRAPGRCACGGLRGPDGECAACRARRLGTHEPARVASSRETGPGAALGDLHAATGGGGAKPQAGLAGAHRSGGSPQR